jgi:hypothetical protein
MRLRNYAVLPSKPDNVPAAVSWIAIRCRDLTAIGSNVWDPLHTMEIPSSPSTDPVVRARKGDPTILPLCT